jgi:peptidoglycan/xylan/chitin deacetylase (PgdA/CDA1 family)
MWSSHLSRLRRWFRADSAGDGVILLYHRVAEVNADPWGLCVSPQHFAEHLEVLRRCARPVHLTELVEGITQGRVPRKAAAVTLDDGYHDNFDCAFPTLARYGLPATYFLTAGALVERREFWWDELEQILLQPGRLPSTLKLTIDGRPCEWELGTAAEYGEHDALEHREWRTWHPAPTMRHELYRTLWNQFYRLVYADKLKMLDELLTWAGAGPPSRQTHRRLSVDEATQLAKSDLAQIGAHTVTHPGLPHLPAA